MEKLYYEFDEQKLNKILETLEENYEKIEIIDKGIIKEDNDDTNLIKVSEDLKNIYLMFEEDKIDIPCLLQLINIIYRKYFKYQLSTKRKVYYNTILFFSLIKIQNCMNKKESEDINICKIILHIYYEFQLYNYIDNIKKDIKEIEKDYNKESITNSYIMHYEDDIYYLEFIKTHSYMYYFDIKDELIKIFDDIDKYIENLKNHITEKEPNNELIMNTKSKNKIDLIDFQISIFEKNEKILNKYNYYNEYIKNKYHMEDEEIKNTYFWINQYSFINNTLHIKNIMAKLYYDRYKINCDEKDKIRAKNIIENNIRNINKYSDLTTDDIYYIFSEALGETLFNIYKEYSEFEKVIYIFAEQNNKIGSINNGDKKTIDNLDKERFYIFNIFKIMLENNYKSEKLEIIVDIYTSINIKYIKKFSGNILEFGLLDYKYMLNYEVIYKVFIDINKMYKLYYYHYKTKIRLNTDLYKYISEIFSPIKYNIENKFDSKDGNIKIDNIFDFFSSFLNIITNKKDNNRYDIVVYIINVLKNYIDEKEYKSKLEYLLIVSLHCLNKDNTKTLIDIFNKEDFNNYKLIIRLINECAKSEVLKGDTKIKNKNVLIDIYEIMSNTRKELIVMRLFDYIESAETYRGKNNKWKGKVVDIQYLNKDYTLCYHFNSYSKKYKLKDGYIAISQIRNTLVHRKNEHKVEQFIEHKKNALKFINEQFNSIIKCLFNVIIENKLLTDEEFRSDKF